MGKLAARIAAGLAIALFLVTVFFVVYAVRIFGRANTLAKQIDSGQTSLDDGAQAYQNLAKSSWLQWPLYRVRNSLRERYVAEADRVMADYREESESTPVSVRDWQRAATMLNSALNLAPDDKLIRGKSKVAVGYLNMLHRPPYIRTARKDFEEALALLPKNTPDPHLGLASIYMVDGDLDKAESELNQSQTNGFRPGRRRQKDLADAYRHKGELLLAAGRKTHDMSRMQDYLTRGDSDLAHAQSLYQQISPFLDGANQAEHVSEEREQVAKTLADSHLVTDHPASNP
jgi:ATP/maltotriose-dependent transcriptional regulator MalT